MTPERWRRAQEVFLAATEREAGSRPAYLDGECGGDPELRAEVESLLSSFKAAPDSFLELPAIEEVPALAPAQVPALVVGKGMRLGPYEILSPLGAGGMGEVYRATDERLGREVAIKVLPPELSHDTSRVKRFEKEARSASALNHPNIVTVYDFGSSGGLSYIAMEKVEGETLRKLVSSGPMPVKKLLAIATQIADGLARAHEAGIVHRDLKPENVMVTRDGLVKILDFGLAKLTTTGSGSDEGSKLPTMSGTTPGVIMGTVGYMSPEQAGGAAVDFRSDQFSFGSILYELVTGKRAFTGKTPIDVLGAILNDEPQPIAAANLRIPTQLRWIIERCLSKEPRQRYSSTDDVARDLATLRDHLSEATSGAAAGARVRRRFWRPALLGAVAVIVVAGGIFQLTKRSPLPRPPLRVRQLTSNSAENPVASGEISPDGKYLAYADKAGMHIKLIETGEVQTVPEPEALKGRGMSWEDPIVWYPDSTKFFAKAARSLWVVLVMGGPPRKLRDDADVYSVSPDGSSIAFGTRTGKFGDQEVWLMRPSGEGARKVYDADANSGIVAFAWFRDGLRVAYLRVDASGPHMLSRDLRGGPVTTILPSKTVDQMTTTRINSVAWSPDGRFIYSLPESERDNVTSDSYNFWDLPIDPRTGEAIGQPRRLTNWSGFGVNASGAIVNGTRLAFRKWLDHSTVYLASLEAGGTAIGTPKHFTLSESGSWPVTWTADGKSLVLNDNRGGHDGIYRQSLDDGTPEPLVVGTEDAQAQCVSPDGAWVLYGPPVPSREPARPMKIMRTPITGGPSQLVLEGLPEAVVACSRSPATLCVVGEVTENRRQLVFTALDPVKGRGAELARTDKDPNNDYVFSSSFLSPDGTRIALCLSPEEPIRILSLRGQPAQEVRLKGWSIVGSLRWAADGKGFYVGSGLPGTAVLLHVDLQGNARVLWQQPVSHWMAGVPSPDGRDLAIVGSGMDANMWMMENF